ncbi:two-component system, OmpR family, sensor histidine kinase MtrB [Haloechinothrix alba]|uniref:Sensor histidine kinase MtrB n=2 Tax=Haloechinothrix alba TaxID=664784 RepID=A0A238VBY6_9PSEU|nr:two-component system, OmpR family, sensor histidine kinase MtrB [Haloechinothrix alba]
MTRAVARRIGRLGRRARQQWSGIGSLWRTSLQFRVTASTLALSSAVVFLLGMVLQNQITTRLLETKEADAIEQTRASLQVAEQELVGIDADPDTLGARLENALTQITSTAPGGGDTSGSAAGDFEPVLASGGSDRPEEDTVSAGAYHKVPDGLREFVESGLESTQIHTVGGETYLIVGAPMTSTPRQPQLYLLFPLAAEQNTVATVQNTLVFGGIVLLGLLAAIASLVTRQVVLPVRRAANAAGRFAEGELDKRLSVVGDDDLSKLAISYNEMAASIQQQIRQLEEFGQLQRRFTSDVSHELRTPLTTVRMAADVLYASREQFPDGLSRSAELLVDELDRFEALLRDLLEISRLDAGVEELSAEHIDVRTLIDRVYEQVHGLAGSAGSTIELDLPEEEVYGDVDARRVERILRNLLANAVDHCEGLPVRVQLAANDEAVAIAVRDYGVGLRVGEAELVFSRFWRADPSRNRRTGGTGLGLAISQEDARLHGGELLAWGLPGYGSCFRLTLPRRIGESFEVSPLGLPPDPPDVPENVEGPTEPLAQVPSNVPVADVSGVTAADGELTPDGSESSDRSEPAALLEAGETVVEPEGGSGDADGRRDDGTGDVPGEDDGRTGDVPGEDDGRTGDVPGEDSETTGDPGDGDGTDREEVGR